ncbi:putative RNA-directed DNA polymerase from transposon X-element [Bienertia sinuspersici]
MIWNVQGAGNREFLRALKELVRTHRPKVLTLVETHMGGEHAARVASILGFDGHTRVDAQGFSGGIWVYWHTEQVTIHPIIQDPHITMEISRTGDVPWLFTAVYASPDPTKRQKLWNELKEFTAKHNQPWLIAGDFNETRFSWERSSYYPETSLEFAGASHTWARGNTPHTQKSARLDRAICNGEWSLRFEHAQVKHLPAIQSDHCPLLISPNGFSPLASIKRPFRFQAAWMSHEAFKDFVDAKWNKNLNLVSSLHKMAEDLQDWNQEEEFLEFKALLPMLLRMDFLKLESKLRRELDEVLDQGGDLMVSKSKDRLDK